MFLSRQLKIKKILFLLFWTVHSEIFLNKKQAWFLAFPNKKAQPKNTASLLKKIKNLLPAYTNASHKIDHTKPLEKIHTDLELSLSTETNEENEAGRILDFLRDLSDSFQEEFEELLADDSEKKRFIRALSRIFALFLNTKVDTAKKNQKHN